MGGLAVAMSEFENARSVEAIVDTSFTYVNPEGLSPNGYVPGEEIGRYDLTHGPDVVGNVGVVAAHHEKAVQLIPTWFSAEAIETGVVSRALEALAGQALHAGYEEVLAETTKGSPFEKALQAAGFRTAWIENANGTIGCVKTHPPEPGPDGRLPLSRPVRVNPGELRREQERYEESLRQASSAN